MGHTTGIEELSWFALVVGRRKLLLGFVIRTAEKLLQFLDQVGVPFGRLLIGRCNQPLPPGDRRVDLAHAPKAALKIANGCELFSPVRQPGVPALFQFL